MLMKKTIIGSAIALTLAASSALAGVSATDAARLGKDLTPMGAETKGNGGDIPAWTGGIETPAGFQPGEKFIDPFASDKVKFTITAANFEQYKANLTEGQIAMFKRYPATYKMPVYPTHRSVNYPQKVYDRTLENATQTSLNDGGNGMSNYAEGAPFPIPATGLEVIWNHIVSYRGESGSRVVGQAAPQANGDYTMVKLREEFTFKGNLTDYDDASMKDNNILFYFKQEVVAPARLAGNVLLVHETLNQVQGPRKAWIYNAGQRRVRRAPQVAYDGPGTASDGLRTSDNFGMFNGSPDRYNWKLVSKKEVYIPYNSYKLNGGDLKYDDIIKPGHINQDLTRYELHRVWHVEATLKEGQRHVYSKRTFYIDEDTWQAAAVDHYDGRGELWRVAEGHTIFFYDDKIQTYGIETLYDLQSARYLALGLSNEEENAYNFNLDRKEKEYTPAALRRAGRR
jgi:hypothetical protein